MENKSQKLKEIRKAKELEYGSFSENMNNIGTVWSTLLGLPEPIPGWMVANMYVAAKLLRTKKKFKEDSYDDAENYLYQARLMQKVDNAAEEHLKKIFNTDGIVKDQVDG
jgi:hypothetical protein|tara:strand:+ start:296 stop:625 length:330 start_codon:yes stop_codon:yes gene_type:complete